MESSGMEKVQKSETKVLFSHVGYIADRCCYFDTWAQ